MDHLFRSYHSSSSGDEMYRMSCHTYLGMHKNKTQETVISSCLLCRLTCNPRHPLAWHLTLIAGRGDFVGGAIGGTRFLATGKGGIIGGTTINTFAIFLLLPCNSLGVDPHLLTLLSVGGFTEMLISSFKFGGMGKVMLGSRCTKCSVAGQSQLLYAAKHHGVMRCYTFSCGRLVTRNFVLQCKALQCGVSGSRVLCFMFCGDVMHVIWSISDFAC